MSLSRFSTPRRLIATLLTAACATSVAANTGNFAHPPLIIEEFGVYCPEEAVGQAPAPDTESGFIDLITGDVRVSFHTTLVPAQIGIGFGLRFRLAPGTPPTEGRVIITHPPFGATSTDRESYGVSIESDTFSMTQFDFDRPYEMQLGTWTMAIEVDGEILAQQSFTVVNPADSPASITQCKGPALMS